MAKYKKYFSKKYMFNCIRLICRTCVSSLVTLDLDNQSLELLQNLAFDMRASCMSTLFNQAIQGTSVFNVNSVLFITSESEQKHQTTM